jgi:hypothetical protein
MQEQVRLLALALRHGAPLITADERTGEGRSFARLSGLSC